MRFAGNLMAIGLAILSAESVSSQLIGQSTINPNNDAPRYLNDPSTKNHNSNFDEESSTMLQVQLFGAALLIATAPLPKSILRIQLALAKLNRGER